MNGIQGYFYRLIAGAAVIALARRLLPEGKVQRAAGLIGGCCFALLVLQPLLPLSGLTPEDWLQELPADVAFDQAAAEEENFTLLSRLVAEQTEDYVTQKALELGMEAAVTVWTEPDPSGQVPLPVRIRIRGSYTQAQREALSALLAEELALPREKQEWSP